MKTWLRSLFEGRPRWMNALMVFCAYMAIVYVPWDLFAKPVAEDAEVWFGIMLTGWAAKAAEPLHWAVYAAGAYGFYRMRRWMWPWAAIYVAQIAVGMLVWNVLYIGGLRGWIFGVVSLAVFAGLAAVLWRARPLFGPRRAPLRERYGEWALITGASAGIGAEFARALAAEGLSCALSARREERLRALAAELEKDHQVATRVVPADLADPAGADALAEAVADLEIAVLVNNAGFGYAGRFEKQDAERLRAMVQVNCAAPVVLTSRVLPGMRDRGRGALILTGSIAGRQPLPLHGVYSATKAFDLLFGEALWVELREQGIDVLVVEPGSTETEFHEIAGEVEHAGVPPGDVVRVALEALGRQPVVVCGWLDWLRANGAARLLPRPLVAYIAKSLVAARTREEMR
jgi:short-subunit dehydrogenase